jgi:hypothetical protein
MQAYQFGNNLKHDTAAPVFQNYHLRSTEIRNPSTPEIWGSHNNVKKIMIVFCDATPRSRKSRKL